MNGFCKAVILVCSFVLLFSSQIALAKKSENFIYIKVNQNAITYQEVLERTKLALALAKIEKLTSQDQYLEFRQITQKIIEEEIIKQEGRKFNIVASFEEIEQGIEIFQIKQNKTPEQFQKFLKKNQLSYESLKSKIEAEIVWSKIINQLLKPRVVVSEIEIREFLEQKEIEIESKEYLLNQIVISNSEKSKQIVNKLYEELERGASFEDLVDQFSNSLSFETHDSKTWLSKSDLNINIYSAISNLAKGQYSKPLKIDDKYLVVRLVDIRRKKEISKKNREFAFQYIFNKKLETKAKGYIKSLERQSFVEIQTNK